jgi:hypothetical protein
MTPVNPQFGQGIGAAGYTLFAKTGQILSGPCGYTCHSVLHPQFPKKVLSSTKVSLFQNPVIRQDHNFGTAVPDLRGKPGFRPISQEFIPKPTGFWNKTKYFQNKQIRKFHTQYKLIVIYFAMLSKNKTPPFLSNFSFERGDLQAVCLLRQG